MAFLLDSNIIIYSYLNEFDFLRKLIIDQSCMVSEISRIEVLGYHALKKEEDKYFQDVFAYVPILLPNQNIFNQAINLRKKYNLKLGDSLIGATALVYNLNIYTRNTADFERIKDLKVFNPII
ncbi:type II toxin-antitoxin system VapC family toxin [Pedobacter miscanthi]|nr:type II toxin-antitoxin system VapC family toxin [Pedobacter miscanthi]